MRIRLGRYATSSRNTPDVGTTGRQFTRLYKRVAVALLLAAGLVAGASSAWSQIDAEFSEDASGDLKHCRELVNAGQFEEARRELTELLNKDPDCVEAYEIVGISYLKQGDYPQAESSLRKAYDIAPNNSSVLNNLGNALYRQNKLVDSIDVYKRAVALPNNEGFRLWTNLANAYADQGNTEEAIKAFATAIKLKPDFAPSYLGIGRMYCEREQFDQADKNLRLAIKYKPDYASAYYYLGDVEAGRKNYPEAIAYLTKSQKYEHNAQYRAETSRQIDKLKEDAHMAKSLPPIPAAVSSATPTGHNRMSSTMVETTVAAGTSDSKDAALKRVNQLLMKRNWAAAQHDLEEIQARWGRDDPVVWNNLGYARVHQGEGGSSQAYLDAIDDYKKAIELRHGGFSAAQYNLGQAYRLLDSRRFAREAEEAFRQSISDAQAENKPCPLTYNALGLMQKQRGDLKGAEASYKLAIMQAGTDLPVAHYNRALLLEQTDRSKAAVQEYKAYLTLEPRGLNADKARFRLKRLGIEPPSAPGNRTGG